MKNHTLFVLTLSLLMTRAMAQKSITSGTLVNENGTALEIRSVFDPLPPTGYAPIRVVATSGSSSDSQWDFTFQSRTQQHRAGNTHRSSFRILVPARGTQSASFLVPLSVSYGDSSSYGNSSHQLAITLDAAGIGHRDFNAYDKRVYGFPAIAISKALADRNHSRLKDETEQRKKSVSSSGSSTEMFGSTFDPDDLPEDWRGLSGFDVLMIANTEWLMLKPGQRLAIIQWVRLGGQLDVYSTATATSVSLGIPSEVSLGQVNLLTWDGKDLDAAKTVARYWGHGTREKTLTESYTGQTGDVPYKTPNWRLLESLGTRSFASWQVIVFLVIFGILVGPVNLFVLAPQGKRHKLFITTPILSVSASFLMLGIILFQDGIGAVGSRFVVINLVPEEAAAYVTQEQASRTGVLLGASFEMKQPAVIEPLALPNTPWVKLKNDSSSQAVELAQDGAQRSGNYFQSRAEQGQILRAAISTRARLEMKAGLPAEAAPEIISALGFTLSTLFYVDAKGDVWKATQPLVTGKQVKLEKTNDVELKKSWQSITDLTEGQLQRRLEAFGNGKLPLNSFLASASEAPDFTIESLSSIRWKADRVAVFGHMAQP